MEFKYEGLSDIFEKFDFVEEVRVIFGNLNEDELQDERMKLAFEVVKKEDESITFEVNKEKSLVKFFKNRGK